MTNSISVSVSTRSETKIISVSFRSVLASFEDVGGFRRRQGDSGRSGSAAASGGGGGRFRRRRGGFRRLATTSGEGEGAAEAGQAVAVAGVHTLGFLPLPRGEERSAGGVSYRAHWGGEEGSAPTKPDRTPAPDPSSLRGRGRGNSNAMSPAAIATSHRPPLTISASPKDRPSLHHLLLLLPDLPPPPPPPVGPPTGPDVKNATMFPLRPVSDETAIHVLNPHEMW